MADIILISGSTLGSAEYVAEHLAEKLEETGHSTTTLHGPQLEEVPSEGFWLVVSSTHGAGDLPDNLLPLYKAIQEQKPDLSGIQYGALGIGSKEYDTFCEAIEKIDRLLTEHGAVRLGEIEKINVLDHDIPEDPAEIWIDSWKNLLPSV